MQQHLRLLHLLSIIERKHELSALDPSSRAILDIVVEREMAGLRTTAEDVIQRADISRASVYRKLNGLKANGSLTEVWSDHQLTYSVGDKMSKFCDEIVAAIAKPAV